MTKHCLRWKDVKCKNINGEDTYLCIPTVIEIHSRGTLLSKILAMKPQKPISFDAAINLASEEQTKAFQERRMGSDRGQHCWYTDNFVEWIAELGYHIELTGDEFESYALTDLVA